MIQIFKNTFMKHIFLSIFLLGFLNLSSAQEIKAKKNSFSLGTGYSRSEAMHGFLLSLHYERQIARRWIAEISYLNNMQIEGLYNKINNESPHSMNYIRNANDITKSDVYPYLDRVPKSELEREGLFNNFNRFNTDYSHSLSFLLGYQLFKKGKHQLQVKSGLLLSYANYDDADEWGFSYFQPNDFEADKIPIIYDSRLMIRNINWGYYIYTIDYQYNIKKNLSLGLRHAWFYHENTVIDNQLTAQILLSKKF